ncbi:MAG: D-alanyl-D-alanine carboxypeptidase family protein [Ruminococcus sp.]|nr:D-alanyl-D-alanine carboxypeptidase family protein [Ruminococcus sp.]
MQKRRISYSRIILVTLLVIVLIFGIDFFKRSAALKDPNKTLKISVVGMTATSEPEKENTQTNIPVTENDYVKAGIDEEKYYSIEKSKSEIYLGELAVINAEYPCRFPDIETLLVNIFENKEGDSYKLSYLTHTAHKSIISPLNSMMNDFYSLYGHNDVTIVTAYTSYAAQNEAYIAPSGDVITSENSIMAGNSEHHTGYAIDLKLVSDAGKISAFDGTGDYAWITQNCYKYGFIIRYPEGKENSTGVSYQPAHLRYVGVPHSYIMHENGFTLEEYINHLKQYVYGYDHLKYKLYGYDYEIYYVPIDGQNTIVPVPSDKAYSISGNNMDGFIVTICSQETAVSNNQANQPVQTEPPTDTNSES